MCKSCLNYYLKKQTLIASVNEVGYVVCFLTLELESGTSHYLHMELNLQK